MADKLRIGIIFGGRSGEHAVSIASAASVMAAIDQSKYEVVPIGITPEGRWLAGVNPQALAAGAPMRESAEGVTAVTLTGDPTLHGLVPAGPPDGGASRVGGPLDVVIPVLHGTYGEDGTLQGLLEMAGVAYAGCGVLGSALGMDKEKAKLVFKAAGLPVVDWVTVRRLELDRDAAAVCARIEAAFSYPVFVKPANMGSSVGVGKAHDRAELRAALTTALEYDRKAIVEPGINARELECGVLGNDEPRASIVGEVVSSNEFYDYRAKYLDNASRLFLPAEITGEQSDEIRRLAVAAFLALDLSGLARVDCFLDRESGQLYLNEVNTMPGFTQISMYPKLWEASGVTYPQLLDRLIELALERQADKARTRTSYVPDA
ncbi:MAG TPA: D-alanine--D-alanine ligase family protein [Ktedonobacterales bacterium]|jgi:D-alanine-D-alanine ligase|nr:D-alanine--D-alanine ligase family protein [Ktedonobacterales bacterium]